VSAGEAGTPTDPIDACRQQVVRQYRGEIMDYAAELCDDKERANAAVDRAFSRAFASWRECGRAGNFRHWVRGIVVDLCTDRAEA
jgi:DNA-directed RNA polymerase specialized sigma24 family protein